MASRGRGGKLLFFYVEKCLKRHFCFSEWITERRLQWRDRTSIIFNKRSNWNILDCTLCEAALAFTDGNEVGSCPTCLDGF